MRLDPGWPGGARALGAAALAYAVLAVLWAAPASLSPADVIPDLGDPLHLSWVMAWDAHQIVRRPWALFDSNSFYPYPRSLAFGDHLLPEALLVAPVNALTGNAVLASNLAVLLALTLTATTMFLLVGEVTGSAWAAFLAGLAFAFNSFTRSEILRVQVLNMEWWPLALLCLARFARGGEGRDAWGFSLALLLQGLSGAYYLVYSALLGLPWLVAAYAGARRRPSLREIRALALPLSVAAALSLPVLLPYAVQLRSMGFEKELRPGVDLLSYLVPVRDAWLWAGHLQFLGPTPGVPHFLGLLGAALMGWGAVRLLLGRLVGGARVVGGLAFVTALVGLLLSLGPLLRVDGVSLGPGPYALLYRFVPLTRGMASPARSVVLVLLGGAVLLGLSLEALLRPLSGRSRALLSCALAVLLPLEHWSPSHTGAAVPTGGLVPEVYSYLREDSREPLVDLPLYPDVSKRFWATYLYFSTYHWRPIPVGRTSFYPPAHDYLAWSLRDFPDETSLSLLDELGIRTLVVHPFVWEVAGDRSRRLDLLDNDPRVTLVRRFHGTPPERFAALQLGEERVYRIHPGGPLKAPCTPSDEVPRSGWTLRSTGMRPELALDSDRRTAWFTHTPQKPGDRLEVTLPRPETVAAVAIEMWYPHTEFARNLVLVVRPEGGEWHRVRYLDGAAERAALLRELVERPREARMVLRMPPETVREVRLGVGFREEDGSWPAWSVPELRLYRECR